MGYELHITRADSCMESKETGIQKDEWNEYVKGDVELTISNIVSINTPFGTLSMEGDFAIWINSGNQVIFQYRDGEISVNNPDEKAIQKMKEIAKRISARVVGDEGEEY